jgi:hypothetical protein
LLANGGWFSPGTPASSTTKTGRHDIIVAEILSKVALNTINQILNQITLHHGDSIVMYVVSYIFVIVFITEVDCGWPGPFYNGFLLGQKTNVGSIIFFRYACT